MLKKALLLFLLGCLVMPLEAQNTSTQGKEFWLSFMHNGFRDHDLGNWVINQVLISAKRDCTGTVSNPLTGWSQTFSVSANNITTIEIPENQGYHNSTQHEIILEKGIKVTASDTISVYCTNIAYVSFDASFVLPVESLGDEYIVQSCDQSTYGSINSYVTNNETTAFVIVATEDNTEIEITPKVNTLGGHLANEPFTITMNAGETYHVRSTRQGYQRDLSGTHILAADCKRIAVFNGNTITCVPVDQGNGYDHVFEQAMPLRSWGKNFVVTSSRNRRRDFIKITSSANNNIITKNGVTLTTLRAGESYYFPMLESEGSCYLQSTQPSAVYLYNNSSYDRYLGDPSMVWIAPVEQRIKDVTFSTFDHYNINIETHNVNIIVNTEDIANVYLNGTQISPLSFNRVNGNSNYSYARMEINHGVHRITCENGFNAHVYGFGDAKGYAYLVGSNAKDLSSHLTINDETVLPNESFAYCAEQEVTFNADVNFSEYDLLWDFGDGTTSTENPTTHTYHERRIYDASLTISADGGGCTGSNSDTTYFYIDATQQYITHSDEVCEGELYSGFGFNNIRINNDTILTRLQDNPIHNECQDSVLVYITTHPTYHRPIDDSRCWQGQPGVYDNYGFSFVYEQPGTYDRELLLQTHPYGCDSIIYLHLVVDNQITHEFDTVTCSTFVWDDITYSGTDDIVHTYSTPNGCDSIVTCHLQVGGVIHGDTLHHSGCDSFVWYDTEYSETRLYSKELPTALGCDSIVYLDLRLTYSPTPDKIRCTDSGVVVFGDPHGTADTIAVVTNTEFFSFQYTFEVKESLHNENECVWDECVWTISKPSWAIEFGDPELSNGYYSSKCIVYVAERDDNLVELTATISNGCNTVQRKFYLKSSFLGIGEQSTLQPDFNIVPNPNNGQMTLDFEHWEGRVEVKVYDMRGTLIDRFQTESTTESFSMPYHLNTDASGIYCFTVTGRNGTIDKRVIVTH